MTPHGSPRRHRRSGLRNRDLVDHRRSRGGGPIVEHEIRGNRAGFRDADGIDMVIGPCTKMQHGRRSGAKPDHRLDLLELPVRAVNHLDLGADRMGQPATVTSTW